MVAIRMRNNLIALVFTFEMFIFLTLSRTCFLLLNGYANRIGSLTFYCCSAFYAIFIWWWGGVYYHLLCKQLFIEFTTELNYGFNWNAASRVRAKNNIKSSIKFIIFGLQPVHQRRFQSAVFYLCTPERTGVSYDVRVRDRNFYWRLTRREKA